MPNKLWVLALPVLNGRHEHKRFGQRRDSVYRQISVWIQTQVFNIHGDKWCHQPQMGMAACKPTVSLLWGPIITYCQIWVSWDQMRGGKKWAVTTWVSRIGKRMALYTEGKREDSFELFENWRDMQWQILAKKKKILVNIVGVFKGLGSIHGTHRFLGRAPPRHQTPLVSLLSSAHVHSIPLHVHCAQRTPGPTRVLIF